MKKLILSLSLALPLAGAVTYLFLSPEAFSGFSGIVIWIFLGYCAIIVVAQLTAALLAIGRLIDEMTHKKAPSRRIMLR